MAVSYTHLDVYKRQLLMLGMIGEYIGRIYLCINQSPQYVIREVYSKRDKELSEDLQNDTKWRCS